LSPDSLLHREEDEALKLGTIYKLIGEVAPRMQALLEGRPDLQCHFNVAYKGIVKKPVRKVVVVKEPRPTLNVSDL
jgi:hypothetical protein